MDYQKLYDDFMIGYKQSETTPSAVGETLARIAGFFPNYNTAMVRAERVFAMVHANIASGNDDNGKAISSAKADTIADASPEASTFKEAKAHVANIEMLIGALKFLQKSLEVEYVNSSM